MSALVLLHGFTGHPASFQKLLTKLPLQARVLCPILLGHDGNEPAPDAPPSFAAEVTRLADQIRGAHREPAHLVGYSLGARVALGLLAAYPELFSRATLISGHPGLASLAERQARAAADERWVELLHTRGLTEFLHEWEQQPLFQTQTALPPAVLTAQAAVRRRHSAKGLAQSLRTLGLAHMPDFWPALAQIALPVQLVVGARDEKFSALADRAAPLFRAATVVRIPDVGHNVLLEAPDALCALL